MFVSLIVSFIATRTMPCQEARQLTMEQKALKGTCIFFFTLCFVGWSQYVWRLELNFPDQRSVAKFQEICIICFSNISQSFWLCMTIYIHNYIYIHTHQQQFQHVLVADDKSQESKLTRQNIYLIDHSNSLLIIFSGLFFCFVFLACEDLDPLLGSIMKWSIDRSICEQVMYWSICSFLWKIGDHYMCV